MGDASNITVRSLTRADEPHWRRLWSACLAFYETRVRAEVCLTTVARPLSQAEHPAALIAEADGRPVGLAHCIFHRHNWKIEDVCYPQDPYADLSARGKGVGRALIEAVYAAADARGIPAVYWLTQSFNTTARKLYDRIGEVTPFVKYQRGQIR